MRCMRSLASPRDGWEQINVSSKGNALVEPKNDRPSGLSALACCWSAARFCNSRVRRSVDDLSVKDCHLAFHILELGRGHCIPIPVPHRNVSFLTFFDYPNLIFKKKLSGRPRSIGTKSSVDIYGLGHIKRMLSINGLQRLPLD